MYLRPDSRLFAFIISLSITGVTYSTPNHFSETQLNHTMQTVIPKLMKDQSIPGMAIAVIKDDKTYYYNYGLADIEGNKPVTNKTIFELGSVSKTFTGVLGAESVIRNEIKLSDPVNKYWPELTGKQWAEVSMLNLATYSAGGLPLQIPEEITNKNSLLNYYQNWQPTWKPSTQRLYSNASIGLFGLLTANAAKMEFKQMMDERLIKPLKLTNTWFNVPSSNMSNYAWGYVNTKPVRVSVAMLDNESYGIKSSVEDMAYWIRVNMDNHIVNSSILREAIDLSQKTQYHVENGIEQGLGWEMYELPVKEDIIIKNSDNKNALSSYAIKPSVSNEKLKKEYFVHKTGATSGFGAYVAFIPSHKVGIVMLANKNIPNVERVKTAFTIFNTLN